MLNIKKKILSRFPTLYTKWLQHSRKSLSRNLQGDGVEIGPGNLPMLFSNKVNMTYIDINTQETLSRFHPQYKFDNLTNFIIADADNLPKVTNNTYDFLVANHVIEHVKNPLKAFKRWYEVVKPGGHLIIIFPNRDECFDKGRPYTTISHLVSEFKLANDSKEMHTNLKNHLYEHYANVRYKDDTTRMHKELDIEKEIRRGSSHYHVWGEENTHSFFSTANTIGLPLEIEQFEHKMGELRFLIKKME
jgi:ubiquinone/menaquinone biosynthesis C-methylase UbiE